MHFSQKLLVFGATLFFVGSATALDIDWDGSIGEDEHEYVPAISNPLFNETPQITTEIRPIYMHQKMPSNQAGLFGGSINVVAAEIRIALTDNLGFLATKDGYAWVDFDNTTNTITDDPEGLADISLGLKYAFWNNVEDQSIMTVGLEYEPPSGTLAIQTTLAHPLDNVDLQESGDGFINVFLTGAKRYEKLGLQASVGVNAAIDGDHDSSLIHYTLHADYELVEGLYPMVSLNGFTIYDEANRPGMTASAVAGFDGVDLVNLGCSIDCGTVLTAAGGIRMRATDNLIFGLGIEKSIARQDLMDWRSYLDVILHF
ncbi:MAG: hypothetical protein HND53_13895 [Proteobacteria bacterium]|nr:hypothetical protein [Pseudomonadota bacterium]NOG61590.1 hypothetical protein [Pseudomonadota bacterium]